MCTRPHPLARRRVGLAALGLAAALAASPVAAVDVRVPLRLDEAFLDAQVRAALLDADGTLSLASPDPCQALVLEGAAVAPEPGAGALALRAPVRARGGLPALGRCWLPVKLGGELTILQAPRLDASRTRLDLRVVDVRLQLRDAPWWLPEPELERWVGGALRPRLEAVAVDLGPALEEIRAVLPLFARPAVGEAIAASLVLDDPRVEPEGLRVGLRFQTPREPPAGPVREAPARSEEVEAILVAWDAFLGFVLSHAARDAPHHRTALLAVLLEGRHDLVEALVATRPTAEDPVRRLFLRTWARLAPVLREVDPRLPAGDALRTLAFVAAGDALAALDAAGPGLGLEISRDGLRRLARVLAPEAASDPLAWSDALDPALREVFGFPPSPVRPDPAPTAGEAAPGGPAAEGAPFEEEPEAPGSPLEPPSSGTSGPEVPPAASLRERLPRLLTALLPAAAHAQSDPPVAGHPPAEEAAALARALHHQVPGPKDAAEHVALVASLLQAVAAGVLREETLAAHLHEPFRALVLATSWQESCFRQWVRRAGQVVPLRSGAGAVGIMQVSERVWRGFYAPDSLRQDVAYNASAGSEILLHYLRDYAIPDAAHDPREPETLARITWAMYNAGPRARSRVHDAATPARLRRLDGRFLERYRAMRAGRVGDVARCYGA